jgi:hypothetical protein
MTQNAKEILNQNVDQLDPEAVTKLENYQRLHWDVFYKNNNVNFYKDRHYIKHEFLELV